MPNYLIGLSIPEEKIIDYIPEKTKMLSNMIPGNLSTYIYDNEIDYYNEYRSSYFAITMKKHGWDCLRHYEIMANGCIPYFIDIEYCPAHSMSLLPKKLFIYGNTLYEKYKNKNIDDLTIDDKNELNKLIKDILLFTKTNLTTKCITKQILEKSNHINVNKILVITGQEGVPDCMRGLILNGLKNMFKNNCHEYPKTSYIYKNNYDYKNMYAKGFTWTGLIENSNDYRDDNLDNTILEDINNKKYDIVIFGAIARGLPLYDIIAKVYKPDEIIVICGDDQHSCDHSILVRNNNNHFFTRGETFYNFF